MLMSHQALQACRITLSARRPGNVIAPWPRQRPPGPALLSPLATSSLGCSRSPALLLHSRCPPLDGNRCAARQHLYQAEAPAHVCISKRAPYSQVRPPAPQPPPTRPPHTLCALDDQLATSTRRIRVFSPDGYRLRAPEARLRMHHGSRSRPGGLGQQVLRRRGSGQPQHIMGPRDRVVDV